MAADAAAGREDEGHPEVRRDRDASGGKPQRDRRSARVSSGDWDRPEGRAAALPERSLDIAPRKAAAREDPQQPGAEPIVGPREHWPRRRRRVEGLRFPVEQVPDHHRPDQARRVSGPACHAEHLHDARGDRHVLDGD